MKVALSYVEALSKGGAEKAEAVALLALMQQRGTIIALTFLAP